MIKITLKDFKGLKKAILFKKIFESKADQYFKDSIIHGFNTETGKLIKP